MHFSLKDIETLLRSISSKETKINVYSWWYILSTWFWLGRMPFAPGTFGSIGAYPIYYFIAKGSTSIQELNNSLLFAIILLIIVGFFAIIRFHRESGSIDDGRIVVDEVAGQLTTIFIAFEDLNKIVSFYFSDLTVNESIFYTFSISLLLFRFFDITKILYIRNLERSFKNTFGVIADDILAGLYGGLTICLIFKIHNFIFTLL